MNIHVQMEMCFQFSAGMYPEAVLLYHMVTLYITFWGITKPLFQAVLAFYIHTSNV